MLSSNISLQNVISLYQFSRTGQVRVPVASDVALFSNFLHITGVSVSGGSVGDDVPSLTTVEDAGASISQLHIINQMIQRLYNSQEQKSEATAALKSKLQEVEVTGNNIQELRQKLRALSNELLRNQQIQRVDPTQLRAQSAERLTNTRLDHHSSIGEQHEIVHDEGSILDITA